MKHWEDLCLFFKCLFKSAFLETFWSQIAHWKLFPWWLSFMCELYPDLVKYPLWQTSHLNGRWLPCSEDICFFQSSSRTNVWGQYWHCIIFDPVYGICVYSKALCSICGSYAGMPEIRSKIYKLIGIFKFNSQSKRWRHRIYEVILILHIDLIFLLDYYIWWLLRK